MEELKRLKDYEEAFEGLTSLCTHLTNQCTQLTFCTEVFCVQYLVYRRVH